jgi:hypothetical protein
VQLSQNLWGEGCIHGGILQLTWGRLKELSDGVGLTSIGVGCCCHVHNRQAMAPHNGNLNRLSADHGRYKSRSVTYTAADLWFDLLFLKKILFMH